MTVLDETTQIQDHGLDVIRKAGRFIVPGDKTGYYLAVNILDAITGSFSPSGLSKEMKITTITVSDTAIVIPATALTDRNSMSIYNKSTTTIVYIGPSNSVAASSVDGTTSGWEIDPGSYFSLDIKDDIEIYAICPSGESAQLKIMELA